MNFQKIIFTLVVSHLAINSYAQDNQLRITELRAELLKQEQLLTELGDKITQQEEHVFLIIKKIETYRQMSDDFLKRNFSKETLNQKITDLDDELVNFLSTFVLDFYHNHITGTNILEILKKHFIRSEDCVGMLKFNFMRYKVEEFLLMNIIQQWHECIIKIKTLCNEIENIKQNNQAQ